MATNTQQDTGAFNFPEDSLTASSGTPNDPNTAGNFATWLHGVGSTGFVVQGMTFTVDYVVPEVDISAGKALFEIASVSSQDDEGGATTTRDEGNTFVSETTTTTLSLTDNDVNEIFVYIDLDQDDQTFFQARTDGGTPSATSAFKIGEVDTSADTKDEKFGRYFTFRHDIDVNGKDFFNIGNLGTDGSDPTDIDGIADFADGPVMIGAKDSAPADSLFDSGSDWGQIAFHLDEVNDEIEVKAIESDGSTTITNTIGSGSGASVALDLADDGNNESTSLSEIATTNDSNSIFTEDASDKLLIDAGKNWPTSDVAEIIDHPDDGGSITVMDMGVTNSPSAGTQESLEMDVDGTKFVQLYAEADGSGGLQNKRVDISENVSLDDGTTEISSTEFNLLNNMSAKTGSDSNFVTGTSGSTDEIVKWDSNGDAVAGGNSVSDFALVAGDTFTGNINLNDDVAAEFGTDTDYWLRYDSGNTQIELESTDIDGNGSNGVIWSVDDGDQILDIHGDMQFPGLSGSPKFSNHDHSESGLTTVPNDGLKNDTVNITAGDGLINGGNVALGGSTTIDARIEIEDNGSVQTSVYNLNFGNNLSVTDDGDNTVTLQSTASGGNPVALDLGNDGTDESADLLRINVSGDTNGVISENATDEMLIDLSKNWPTADSAASLTLGDNETVAWGADDDYEMEYVSGNSRFEFRSKDIDGGGTTGDLFRVDDGTQIIDIIGGLSFDTGANTDSLLDEDGIDRSSSGSETYTIQNSGSGTMELQISDTISLDGGTTSIDSTEMNLLDGMTGKTGADSQFATGTAGTSGNLAGWNADGDLVDSGNQASDFLLFSGDTMTGSLTMNTGANTDAVLDEGGIDRSSSNAETFNIQNSGSGSMQIQEDGTNVVTEDRSLTGGNAIDAIGDLSSDRTIAVSSGSIQTDELDLSIAPTWTGTHTFSSSSIALQLGDQSADPSSNGDFTRNGSDVKVFSGGSVRNLSDIGGGAVTVDKIAEKTLSGSEDRFHVDDPNNIYSEFFFAISNLQPDADANLEVRVFNLADDDFDTAASYDYASVSNDDSFFLTLTAGDGAEPIDASASEGLDGIFRFTTPGQSIQAHDFDWNITYVEDGGSDHSKRVTAATYDNGSADEVIALQFFLSTGNFSSGTIIQYGVRS